MIIGVGTDVLDIRRLERTVERFGDRFLDRIFASSERARCERRAHSAPCFAQRYAAKEACSKALGTGFRQGVFWRDMIVDNLPTGQPVLILEGGAKRRLEALTPDGMVAEIAVSLSDEFPMANAIVVISAVPAGDRPGRTPTVTPLSTP